MIGVYVLTGALGLLVVYQTVRTVHAWWANGGTPLDPLPGDSTNPDKVQVITEP